MVLDVWCTLLVYYTRGVYVVWVLCMWFVCAWHIVRYCVNCIPKIVVSLWCYGSEVLV